jgi:hypothetical protein
MILSQSWKRHGVCISSNDSILEYRSEYKQSGLDRLKEYRLIVAVSRERRRFR